MKFKSIIVAAAITALSPLVNAFPDKAATIIMPFAPGSITDVSARDFAEEYSKVTKQPAMVVNQLGAQGAIAGTALANSKGDGHTMLFTSSSLPVLDPLLKKDIPYDPMKDFAPVCAVGRIANVVNISKASSIKTISDLVKAAKAEPGKLTFAYTSSNTRLAAELFQFNAGVKLTGVPYKSSATAMVEVASGLVDLIFIDNVSARSFYESDKLRPLGVLDDKRAKSLPNVPTVVEEGIAGPNVAVWFGLYATANTPADVLTQLRQAVKTTLAEEALSNKIGSRGLEPMAMCGEEMNQFQLKEVKFLQDVLKKAGIEPA
jgi:Uncharacterized protein conserved in bacteria